MKKFIAIMTLSFISSFLFSYDIEYRVTDNCVGYSLYDSSEIKNVKKDSVLRKKSSEYKNFYEGNIWSGILVNDLPVLVVVDEENQYGVSISNLELQGSSTKLPEKIITQKKNSSSKKAIPSYFLDVLNSKKQDNLKKYETLIGLKSLTYIADYLDWSNYFFASVSNIGIKLQGYNDEIDFINIKKISINEYECECFIIGKLDNCYENDYECDFDFSWHSINFASTPVGETETVTLKVDGDYLHIFNKSKNKPITTLAYIDDSVMDELVELFKSNTCDLSKVKWPRHADGSCDYDGSKKNENESNIAPFMRMFVKENLKLRAEEDTSSQVLTIMKPGIEVRILEVGKAETIDGINSNWVKVDVQFNPRGNTGDSFIPSMIGWCYGGYLE